MANIFICVEHLVLVLGIIVIVGEYLQGRMKIKATKKKVQEAVDIECWVTCVIFSCLFGFFCIIQCTLGVRYECMSIHACAYS